MMEKPLRDRVDTYLKTIQKKTRIDVEAALSKREDQIKRKKINFNDESNDDINLIKGSFEPELKVFQRFYEDNMSNYLGLREENMSFLKKFKISKKIQNSQKNNFSEKALSPFQNTFADLISQYKMNGYKIKDLSKKNNLFEPTPLLLDNNKILNSFQFNQNVFAYEKDFDYLNKIGDYMNEKIMTEGNFGSEHLTRKISGSEIKQIKKEVTKEELIKDIEANLSQIETSKNLIDNNNYRFVYNLPNLTEVSKVKLPTAESPSYKKTSQRRKKINIDNIETRLSNNNSSVSPKIYKTSLKHNQIKYINDHRKSLNTSENYLEDNISSKGRNDSRIGNLTENKGRLINAANSVIFKDNSKIKLMQNHVEDDKMKVKKEVERLLSIRKNHEVENLYDKSLKNDSNHQEILNYMGIEKNINPVFINLSKKKAEVSDISLLIKDTKFKVNNIDFHNAYQVFSQKYGDFDGIVDHDFDTVKSVDGKINSLDKKLAIKLNKFNNLKGVNF